MRFEITPFKSVGVLEFGMDRAQVRSVLNGGMHEMPNKATYPEHLPECYEEYSIHVYYGEDGKTEAFEFFADAIPLYFDSVDLFSLSADKGIAFLENFKSKATPYDCGFDFLDLGISIYVPLDEKKIEAIMVSKKDYF